MTHQVDQAPEGVFILTATAILQPIGPSNFTQGDPVRLEYVAGPSVNVIDASTETTNPYTETWHVTYTDTHIGIGIGIGIGTEITTDHSIDIAQVNNLRYDSAPIDLIIWILVIVTTVWMLVIDFKLLFWR
jgi:hypothetical protein